MMLFTSIDALIEMPVMLETPKVAISCPPFGTVVGVQWTGSPVAIDWISVPCRAATIDGVQRTERKRQNHGAEENGRLMEALSENLASSSRLFANRPFSGGHQTQPTTK